MVKNLFRAIALGGLMAGSQVGVHGFSLLGPFDTSYQSPNLGYGVGLTSSVREGDAGGPMNLGEEYRWNTPFIVYGFDPTFVEYFGPKGVAAVESAISVFNSLPAMSSMSHDLSEYPLEAVRFNYTAQQLSIIDVKSLVMSAMLEQLGLAAPERYVKTIFQQRQINNQFFYSVIGRNFSPIPVVEGDTRSYTYSPYVNGTLYTYAIRHILTPADYYDAQDIAVDVANPRISVAAAAGLQTGAVDPRVEGLVHGGSGLARGAGRFFTGLTRDDVGGLRYLYHPSRTNVETLPSGAFTGGAGSSGGGFGGGSSGEPWTITIPFISTNAVAGTNGAVNTAGLVNQAWRGGVDKLVFVRIDADPFIGQYPRPLVLRYSERVFDASRRRFVTQNVQRQFTRPDITFAAADLGAFGASPSPYIYSRSIDFTSNAQLNTTTGEPAAGPGTINSGPAGATLILNKVGPWTYNVSETTEDRSSQGFIFGSFDGTTNSPTVYPSGVTAKDLERFIFGRN